MNCDMVNYSVTGIVKMLQKYYGFIGDPKFKVRVKTITGNVEFDHSNREMLDYFTNTKAGIFMVKDREGYNPTVEIWTKDYFDEWNQDDSNSSAS